MEAGRLAGSLHLERAQWGLARERPLGLEPCEVSLDLKVALGFEAQAERLRARLQPLVDAGEAAPGGIAGLEWLAK